MGIPTVMITRQGFSMLVDNSFAGAGLPAEAPKVIYPVAMFVPGADLTPIQEKMDELISGLIRWEPRDNIKTSATATIVSVKGRDYTAALLNLNSLFLRNMWSDGLPFAPPTERLVEWMLTGTDLPPDEPVITILPRGGMATVHTVAVNLSMAGGRPEYMPVLIAALAAMGHEKFAHGLMNTTTCGVYPVMIVNGPVAKQIRLGSGYGCLGPDPLHPSGASIGRALRLLLMNVGGAIPAKGTMSIHGGPARYTNIVFAEDEDGLPPDWESLGVEQGFPPGTNTVTGYTVSSTTNVPGGETGSSDSALASLNRAAGAMGVPNGNYWAMANNPQGAAGILLMARGTAQGLAKFSWSKEKIKTYLWENSHVPPSKLGPPISAWWVPGEEEIPYPVPISLSPKGIRIVVAGGLQSGHMTWLQVGCCAEALTTAEIKLPGNWDALLMQAEQDIGPEAYIE
jgi:hypothetical protein